MSDRISNETSVQPRAKVLVMADWYTPGFRAGGPIRSVVNFAAQLEQVLDIHVLTTDRDLGMQHPYAGIQSNEWIVHSGHRVCYLSPDRLGWRNITHIIHSLRPDHIYLNSMFSRYMTIYPLMFRRFGGTTASVILAPRGMLMTSALAVKPWRKRIFLSLLRLAGVGRMIRFQATNEEEVGDILRVFGRPANIIRLGNLPAPVPAFVPPADKEPGSLRMVFIGRAHPIKQLDYLLGVLQGIEQQVHLTVIMTREDDDYAGRCRQQAAALPANISVHFREDVPHEEITDIIRSNHIFALPTRGENFGHSIYEALAAGRPVLVSDQTPWRRLTAMKAGWDLSLQEPSAFRHCIEEAAALDLGGLLEWCRAAWNLAKSTAEDRPDRKNYITQFSSCISLD
jgi:glycosyltransferase involved in cell wall biosynthesis